MPLYDVVFAKECTDGQGWVMVSTECVVVIRCLEEIRMSPETVFV